ncbi:MAG TPA: RDD family protein [Mycobacteriales bacterium]|nr:RDD family protein [Mycobacteriales bacterium]
MTDQPDPYAPPPAGGPVPQPSPYTSPQPPPYGAPAYGQPSWAAPAGNYASWLQRVGGYVLDILVLVPFYIVAAIGLGVGGGGGALLAVIGYLGALIFGVWNTIFRQGKTGRSLGKEWMGITLLRESDGQPIGAGMTFVRGIAHILDALPLYIGFLWPLWDRKRQTFADKVCGTVVVKN